MYYYKINIIYWSATILKPLKGEVNNIDILRMGIKLYVLDIHVQEKICNHKDIRDKDHILMTWSSLARSIQSDTEQPVNWQQGHVDVTWHVPPT